MKLSVLISLYNAAPFVEECVRSIARQGCDDLELLFADDGSTDGSSEALKQALERHSLAGRARLLRHDENRGPAFRRQELLDAARGEYALFLDVDDVIDPGMFASLLSAAERSGADLVWEDFLEECRFRSVRRVQRCHETPEDLLVAILDGTVGAYLCNKLIRLEFLRRTNVRFTPGITCGEDLLFMCELLVHRPRVAYLDACHYRYRQYARSLVHRPISSHLESYRTTAARLDCLLSGRGEPAAALRRWKARIRFDAMLDLHLSADRLDTFIPEAANDGIWKPGLAKRICRGLASHHLRFIPCLAKSAYMGIKSLSLLRQPKGTK